MNGYSVGLFNDSYDPVIDGVTVTVRNYARWLGRVLGPACVIAPSAPFHRETDEFPVLRFLSAPTIVHPPYRIGLPRLDPRLRGRLRERGFSLVHAHSPFAAGWAALRHARESGIPVVATLHSKFRDNLELNIPFKRLVDSQMRRIAAFFGAVDQVWIPQRHVASTLREYGYTGPYEVVENGIDYVPPADVAPLRAAGAAILGMPEGVPVGLFVGQHILEKNLEFLIRTIPGIVARVKDFRMVFVGSGCARPRLQALVRALGLARVVAFHGPELDRQRLAAIYARGDIFLFPSLWDNAPLVVREAAAFRTPSVLLSGSTSAEVVRDGVNGFLAEHDEEAFSSKVARILDDREGRRRAGAEAQRSLCRTWEDVANEVKERYIDLIAGRPAMAKRRPA